MQETNVNNWEEFEEQLNRVLGERAANRSQLLFRGQRDSTWRLETTLERNGQTNMPVAAYYRLVGRVTPHLEAVTGMSWNVPEYPEIQKLLAEYDSFNLALLRGALPAYDCMAQLRHHGFPSPLLDWTRSSRIAAFFAFRHASKDKVSIYVYCESPEGYKSHGSDKPRIKRLGPYVKTHQRHFRQQSEYTICLSFDFQDVLHKWRYAEHETVFRGRSSQRNEQDVLWKFNIPATERMKVLKLLDEHNLNAFSLLGSEESLMETLALRELSFRESDSQQQEAAAKQRQVATPLASGKPASG
jgi:hypothetical protein